MMRAIAFALLSLLLLPVASTAANAGELTVTVGGIRNSAGEVLATVYDSEASFMKPGLARVSIKLKAAPGRVSFALPELPPGKYAIATFHDENDNGKLDRNFMGLPTEGYGFSNDARGTGGPPSFAAAAVAFDGTNKTVNISLNY